MFTHSSIKEILSTVIAKNQTRLRYISLHLGAFELWLQAEIAFEIHNSSQGKLFAYTHAQGVDITVENPAGASLAAIEIKTILNDSRFGKAFQSIEKGLHDLDGINGTKIKSCAVFVNHLDFDIDGVKRKPDLTTQVMLEKINGVAEKNGFISEKVFFSAKANPRQEWLLLYLCRK